MTQINRALCFFVSIVVHAVLIGAMTLSSPNEVVMTVQGRHEVELSSPKSKTHFRQTVRQDAAPAPALSTSPSEAVTSENVSTDIPSAPIDGASLGLKAAYPRLSRILGEQGLVIVAVKQVEGKMVGVIDSSSGFERLDQAALDAVQGWIATASSSAIKAEKIRFIFKLKASN